MANVLTLEDKNIYKRIRFFRALAALFVVLSVSLVLGMIALVPAFLQARNMLHEAEIRTLNNEAVSDGDARKKLNAQSLLARRQIEVLHQTVEAHDLLVLRAVVGMIAKEREHMTLTHYALSTKDSMPVVSISGVAQDRDALARFGKLLQAHPETRTARIPESLFAGKSGIEFSIPIPIHAQE